MQFGLCRMLHDAYRGSLPLHRSAHRPQLTFLSVRPLVAQFARGSAQLKLYYTILYYTILYYTILYYTILYYTILYYSILCYTNMTWRCACERLDRPREARKNRNYGDRSVYLSEKRKRLHFFKQVQEPADRFDGEGS